MPRALRYFESGSVYEVCFRARNTLPFVCNDIIKFVVQCVLARVQRDNKVVLCHYIWNGSHPHIILICKDAKQLAKFYGEIQKQITDIIKRLLGISCLELWEGRVSVIKIGDLNAVQDRISYLYANPANDNLEDCIEKFPGLSSWKDLLKCQGQLSAIATKTLPWLRLKSIPKLISNTPSTEEDIQVIGNLKIDNKRSHVLLKSPNAWMGCFGIKSDEEVARINAKIIERVREREDIARAKRAAKNKSVVGASELRAQPILKTHTPKKRDNKIFIITTCNRYRIDFIKIVEQFSARCRNCFHRWKSGEFSVKWPDGAFRPPLPPTVNLLSL